MKSNDTDRKLKCEPTTAELLEKLANSPCASREVPASQSLEEYLRKSQTPIDSVRPPENSI